MKILFVDDDTIMQEMIRSFLQDWEVLIASSAEEALEIFPDDYDLIVLTDIHMPGMSGIDLLRKIKTTRPYVQVIMISSTEDTTNLLQAYEAGANDFIVKPFNREDILTALDNTVQKNIRWKKALGQLYRRQK